jgi:hypothetical protein
MLHAHMYGSDITCYMPTCMAVTSHATCQHVLICAQGARGGSFCVMEEVGRSEPRPVVRARVPEPNLLLGIDLYRPARLVLVFSQAPASSKVKVSCCLLLLLLLLLLLHMLHMLVLATTTLLFCHW